MSYSVDTSAILDAWVRYYPPDVFGTLWERLDGLAREGRLFVIDEVRRELESQEDEAFGWVAARPATVVALDAGIQARAVPVISGYPSLTRTKSLMSGAADPFVIALAIERGLTVVTSEKSKPSKPRIPDVCRAMGVPCITWIELFRREGWVL